MSDLKNTPPEPIFGKFNPATTSVDMVTDAKELEFLKGQHKQELMFKIRHSYLPISISVYQAPFNQMGFTPDGEDYVFHLNYFNPTDKGWKDRLVDMVSKGITTQFEMLQLRGGNHKMFAFSLVNAVWEEGLKKKVSWGTLSEKNREPHVIKMYADGGLAQNPINGCLNVWSSDWAMFIVTIPKLSYPIIVYKTPDCDKEIGIVSVRETGEINHIDIRLGHFDPSDISLKREWIDCAYGYFLELDELGHPNVKGDPKTMAQLIVDTVWAEGLRKNVAWTKAEVDHEAAFM